MTFLLPSRMKSAKKLTWAIISLVTVLKTYQLVKPYNQSPVRRICHNYYLTGSRLANRNYTRRIVQSDSFIMRCCLALESTTNLAEPTRMSIHVNYLKTQIPVAARIYSYLCRSLGSAVRKWLLSGLVSGNSPLDWMQANTKLDSANA